MGNQGEREPKKRLLSPPIIRKGVLDGKTYVRFEVSGSRGNFKGRPIVYHPFEGSYRRHEKRFSDMASGIGPRTENIGTKETKLKPGESVTPEKN